MAGDFFITEFQSSNSSTLTDDNGNQSDWIEIYNSGLNAGNLLGYSLTDDVSEPNKWTFPSVTLQPNEFLVVFANDDSSPTSGNDLYTGFRLSASGEYLGLFDPAGNVVSDYEGDSGEYPPQQNDGSFGLAFSGGGTPTLVRPVEEGYFLEPTPGEANAVQYLGVVEPVIVNTDAGFFDQSFTLSMTTATPGANIRFTIDGSTPTETNGFNFNFSLPIASSVNLRAAAFKDGFIPSEIETRTYLFLDDVLNQSNNGSSPPGWPSFWGGKDVDYGMDPEVIEIEGEQAVKDALLAIPTWSITTDLDNLFDPSTGIYSNAIEDGRDWERPASIELINPDGTEGFQIDAGLRIRGGFSRNNFNPKSSFRLFFRGEYGQSTLEYPIHGDEGVTEFRKIDLRTAQNYSWSSGADTRNNFVQDVLARYAQRDLGEPYTRSAWLHLYLNGQYWGLYQTQERSEANFAASYLGGDPDDYDVVKAEWTAVNPTDGNLAAYHRLSAQAHARASDGRTPAFVDNEVYYKAQGLNPDGSVNPSYENLLDVDNLISYMMIILAGGNLDAPISNFGNNERVNNFYAVRNRNGNEGFKFFAHDSEHTLLNVNENRNGPYNDPNFDNGHNYFNPQWLHQQLMANEEYRIRFADKVQEAFFDGGPLSADAQIAKLDAEAAKIDQAIIAESVRWGDSKRSNPLLRSDWVNAINNIRSNFLLNRNAVLLEQFRNTVLRLKTGTNSYNQVVEAPLFPNVAAPSFLLNGIPSIGATVDAGAEVVPASEDGTVWYTTDGSDPRLVGGAVNGTALPFNSLVADSSVVSPGSSWRYEDTGTDLGASWRLPGFDDSSWSQGNAQLGYGDGDEATTVSFGGNSNDKYPTTYFRKQFFVPSENVVAVKFRFIRDDGIVAFLNGAEIVRDNLPTGPITYGTTALSVISNSNESAWTEVTVPVSALQLGATNTLAIEIHQYSQNQGGPVLSSDVSFDAELIVTSVISNSSPITMNESTTMKARVRAADGTWSALRVADFIIPAQSASASNLRITELMYNARDSGVEYIEIQNITSGENATRVDLGGVLVIDGPGETFEFDAIASLGPQKFGLLVNDIAEFQAMYPNVAPEMILGEFEGGLSNGGERIRFETALGETLLDFTYNDSDPWPIAADGAGASLQLVDPSTPVDQLNKPYRWQASWELGGNPGSTGLAPSGIVISEVLANSDDPQLDSIELYNSTGQSIDIGGWYLSDSKDELTKFQIGGGTSLGPGEYVVFDESDFNPTPESPAANHFALSGSAGDQIYLTRLVSTPTSLSLSFEDSVEFGPTFSGESLGRLNDGLGRFVRLHQPTLGLTNFQGQAGPLIISEVNYHPVNPTAAALSFDPTLNDDDLEFVEIHNPTVATVNLTNWRLRGDVDFDFDEMNLAPGESLVIVSFDPDNVNKVAAFEAQYDDSGATIVGPWSGGSLSNGFGRVALQAPDVPSPNAPTVIPRVVIDELVFDDLTAGSNTDGGGDSLNRVATARNGNDPVEWFGDQPSPGSVDLPSGPPTVVNFVRDAGNVVRPDLWTKLAVTFSHDVDVLANSLSIQNESTGGTLVDVDTAGFGYDSNSFTATWDLSSLPALEAAFYTVTLNGSLIVGSQSGVGLDGDGNGIGGDDYSRSLYVAIPGDANLDGNVNVLGDGFALVGSLGQDQAAAWADGDFDGDGRVNVLGDGFALVGHLGSSVVPEGASILSSSVSISEPQRTGDSMALVDEPTASAVTEAMKSPFLLKQQLGAQVMNLKSPQIVNQSNEVVELLSLSGMIKNDRVNQLSGRRFDRLMPQNVNHNDLDQVFSAEIEVIL